MGKTRTTLTIDEAVLRAVKIRAARTGKGDSEVIEDALRRELGLDLLDRLWERNQLPEAEAVALAVEAQHASRPTKRSSRLC
jgi:Arc/MetJ family transcription regulator